MNETRRPSPSRHYQRLANQGRSQRPLDTRDTGRACFGRDRDCRVGLCREEMNNG